MPYKSEKIPINNEKFDRRVKLLKEDKEDIKYFFCFGAGIRQLAREYGVDKRLIQFIIYPERKEKNLKDREARGGSKQYYNKEQWRETMKEHRKYKQFLYKNNFI